MHLQLIFKYLGLVHFKGMLGWKDFLFLGGIFYNCSQIPLKILPSNLFGLIVKCKLGDNGSIHLTRNFQIHSFKSNLNHVLAKHD